MSMLRLYTRVLELLGKEARLGWILAGANLLLAGAQFAEPVLFGKIVDVLSESRSPACSRRPRPGRCWPRGSRSACSPSSAAPRSRCMPTGWRTGSARRC
jgi:hypothetical protein